METTDLITADHNLPTKQKSSSKNLLVQLFGYRAALLHGDTLMVDRWLWLTKHIPRIPAGSKRLLDVGCGTGAFTIGTARRGYRALGLSWDFRNQSVAAQRAALAKAPLAEFEVLDVRKLDQAVLLHNSFDIVICFENIEHIFDDHKLMSDIYRTLTPGGTLLLTTPYLHYRAMTPSDDGPLSETEDGGHVRKGYTKEVLLDLCKQAGFIPREVSYCSGFLSQKVTAVMRTLNYVNPLFSWVVTMPLRVLPAIADTWLTKVLRWPCFSITLVAEKP